jgi:hypothetical protein
MGVFLHAMFDSSRYVVMFAGVGVNSDYFAEEHGAFQTANTECSIEYDNSA